MLLFTIIIGGGRWVFELEPITEEEKMKNSNHLRIVGESDDSSCTEINDIHQLSERTNAVELIFVDSYTEPRMTESNIMGRVMIQVLKQRDPIGVAFERKIKRVFCISI